MEVTAFFPTKDSAAARFITQRRRGPSPEASQAGRPGRMVGELEPHRKVRGP